VGISKKLHIEYILEGDVSQPSIGNSGNQQTIALWQASCKGTLASQQGEVDCQMQQWESARSCTLAKCIQGDVCQQELGRLPQQYESTSKCTLPNETCKGTLATKYWVEIATKARMRKQARGRLPTRTGEIATTARMRKQARGRLPTRTGEIAAAVQINKRVFIAQ